MIIDDVETTIDLMEEIFSMTDYEIMTFTKPSDALEELKKGNIPDLIILDMRMPSMSGEDFCKIVRNELKLSDLKIVIFTASCAVDPDMEQKYNILGYILKPFEIDYLLKMVEKHISV